MLQLEGLTFRIYLSHIWSLCSEKRDSEFYSQRSYLTDCKYRMRVGQSHLSIVRVLRIWVVTHICSPSCNPRNDIARCNSQLRACVWTGLLTATAELFRIEQLKRFHWFFLVSPRYLPRAEVAKNESILHGGQTKLTDRCNSAIVHWNAWLNE